MPDVLTILSMRHVQPALGFSPVYEFEDHLVRLMSAALVVPAARPDWQQRFLRGPARFRVSPMLLEHQPDPGGTLLICAPTPMHLAGLASIKGWRAGYSKVAAFIIDSYQARNYNMPPFVAELDHLFTPILEDVELLEQKTGVATSLLPFGADTLFQGCDRDATGRPIDVIGFGRQPEVYDLPLRDALNKPGSGRFYMHSTLNSPTPISHTDERTVFWKTLRRANLSLAFCTLSYYQRKIPVSIITPRWFESLNAGCIVIGKRPQTPLADQLLGWEDATIDLPDEGADVVRFVEDLLGQTDRLDAARRRSRQQFLKHHDVRYRIAQVLDAVGHPHSAPLTQELADVRSAASAYDPRLDLEMADQT